MTNAVWISYDLGVRGDYEGFYRWLDEHEAIECGDSLAFLRYTYKRSLIESLKADLSDAIDLTKQTRIYLIYRDNAKKMKGVFVFGGRKAPPWTGYATRVGQSEVDES